MNGLRALLFLVLCGVALTGVAHENWAYTSANVHLRAGPARDYPVIAVLPQGFEITVHGCLSDYSWCDVIAGAHRGWIYGAYVHYPYQGHHVPVITYGPSIGIFVVSFVLIDYWDYYYPHYWFYRDRDYWAHRHSPLPVSPSHPGVRPSPPRPPQDGDGHDQDHDDDRPHRRPPSRGDDDAPPLSVPHRDDEEPRLQRPEPEHPDPSRRQLPPEQQPRNDRPRPDEPREQRAPDPYQDRRGERQSGRGERGDSKRERQDR